MNARSLIESRLRVNGDIWISTSSSRGLLLTQINGVTVAPGLEESKDLRAFTAHTKFPNTPESDKQPTVLHVVFLSDGSTREIMATDPPDAIEKMNELIVSEPDITEFDRELKNKLSDE